MSYTLNYRPVAVATDHSGVKTTWILHLV